MDNPYHNNPVDSTWTDLSADERTILYLIARIERERREQTINEWKWTVEELLNETAVTEDYNEALNDLRDAGLASQTQDRHVLTDDGQRLLQIEYARLGSVLDPDIQGVRDSFPSCPHCGDPIAQLSITGPGSVRAGPCGCELPGPADADPLTDRLGKALQLTADDDARYHIRQAMQLVFARSHQFTE